MEQVQDNRVRGQESWNICKSKDNKNNKKSMGAEGKS